jgi:hypothetical protein
MMWGTEDQHGEAAEQQAGAPGSDAGQPGQRFGA